MIFQQLNAGGDRNFAYLIADAASRDAALVDPGDRTAEILRDVGARGLRLAYLRSRRSQRRPPHHPPRDPRPRLTPRVTDG